VRNIEEVWVVEHTEFNRDRELCGIFLKQDEAEAVAKRLADAALSFYRKHNKFNENLGIMERQSKMGGSFSIGTVISSHSMAPKAIVSVIKVKVGELLKIASIVENAMEDEDDAEWITSLGRGGKTAPPSAKGTGNG
jgi:hypothetical protein